MLIWRAGAAPPRSRRERDEGVRRDPFQFVTSLGCALAAATYSTALRGVGAASATIETSNSERDKQLRARPTVYVSSSTSPCSSPGSVLSFERETALPATGKSSPFEIRRIFSTVDGDDR
jgi:hypothetical protein